MSGSNEFPYEDDLLWFTPIGQLKQFLDQAPKDHPDYKKISEIYYVRSGELK